MKWISIEDFLPLPGEKVLLYFGERNGKGYTLGHIYNGTDARGKKIKIWRHNILAIPSHWARPTAQHPPTAR